MASARRPVSLLMIALLALTGFIVTASTTADGSLALSDSKEGGQTPDSESRDNDNVHVGLANNGEGQGTDLNPESKIEGIPMKYMTVGEIYQLSDDRDMIEQAKQDIQSKKRLILGRSNQSSSIRKKRNLGKAARVLVAVGRELLKDKNSQSAPQSSGEGQVTSQSDQPSNDEDVEDYSHRYEPEVPNGRMGDKSDLFGEDRFSLANGNIGGGLGNDQSIFDREFQNGGKRHSRDKGRRDKGKIRKSKNRSSSKDRRDKGKIHKNKNRSRSKDRGGKGKIRKGKNRNKGKNRREKGKIRKNKNHKNKGNDSRPKSRKGKSKGRKRKGRKRKGRRGKGRRG